MQQGNGIVPDANIASSCRSIHRPGVYLLLPRSNRVEHHLPMFDGVDVQVMATPELGANFVQHELVVQPNGGTKDVTTDELEQFMFLLEGELSFELEGKRHDMVEGSYCWLPPQAPYQIKNKSEKTTRLTWIRRKYEKVDGIAIPDPIVAHEKDVQAEHVDTYLEQHLTPYYEDEAFDLGINLQVFEPGVTFSFVETHVIEHGLYMLYGQGVYWLNGEFMEVKKDDFIYMAPYCPQFFYPTGYEKSAYLLYKDVNRDYTKQLT